jgi:catechol 2,3-dioxygenase-like lactoylglutathione lyase family enzyme
MNEEAVVNERNPHSGSAFQAIRAIDYTVIFVRDMAAMRRFYEDILGFPLLRELSPGWIEYRLGDNTLALASQAKLQQIFQRPAAAPRCSWHSRFPRS